MTSLGEGNVGDGSLERRVTYAVEAAASTPVPAGECGFPGKLGTMGGTADGTLRLYKRLRLPINRRPQKEKES